MDTPQNLISELLCLLNRTITVIEKQSDLIVRQNGATTAIAAETAKLHKSTDALKDAVAQNKP